MPGLEKTISACILALDEERQIEGALRSLLGWTHEILVIDHESEDRTVAIARRYADRILTAPRPARSAGVSDGFDALRNMAIDHAAGGWIFYLDADERVPPRLGPLLQRLVQERGHEFEALLIPFQHYFCGKWIRHSGWAPGYTRPQLLKKGRFRYRDRLHEGVAVNGRTWFFPAGDPELAIRHYSYEDLHQYFEKLNRYTDLEAAGLLSSPASHSWQAQLAQFVHDWQAHYEVGRGDLDGLHGFVLSFMSGFYGFATRAKLWDQRRRQGGCATDEPLPGSLREMLEFMLRVAGEGADQWLTASPPPAALTPPPAPSPNQTPRPYDTWPPNPKSKIQTPSGHPKSKIPLPLLWHGPLHADSGYADEARNFVLGLIEAGEPVAVAPVHWGQPARLPAEMKAQLDACTVPYETPAELFVSHTLPALQRRSPHARFNIARTMFETDRLPAGWERALNSMDRVWVPSEFNRESFAGSGVDAAKLAVVPEAVDPASFAAEVEPWPVPGAERFRFLSVFEWTLRKGWDVLLEAFAREFGAEPEVGLVLKVWSSNGRAPDEIVAEADACLRERLSRDCCASAVPQAALGEDLPVRAGSGGPGRPAPRSKAGLADFPNIHLWSERIPVSEMPRLYRAADAFVLPTRGEGWCRPLMEAMAAGLPTIATAWSGLTAFHNSEVGYPLQYRLVPVPPAGAREVPSFAGHRWAEPSVEDLRRLMRQVVDRPREAGRKGRAAQAWIASRFSRAAVAAHVRRELGCCRALLARAEPARAPAAAPSAPTRSGPGVAAAPAASGFPKPAPLAPAAPSRPASAAPHREGLLPRPPASPVDFRAALGRPLRVRWEGDLSLLSGMARAGREFCLGLLAAGDVELSLAEPAVDWPTLHERDDPRWPSLFARRDAPLSGPPDVVIRHQFPPNWSPLSPAERARGSKVVVMQPWELSHLPREEWVQGATHQVDQVWAYSRFVRDAYVRSGVPAQKVRLLPLGFDPHCFTRSGACCALPTQKRCRFLFVGGTLERKGADLLLNAYRRAFTRQDDACLVVKDMATRTFYQGHNLAAAFRQAAADTSGPEILYWDEDLSDPALAALYRACTCVVLPYRAEGFALAPLEGTACGLPAIVTAGGPTDDYLDGTIALRIPAHRVARSDRSPERHPRPAVAWELAPDPDALVEALRWVQRFPAESQRMGERASVHVHRHWRWDQAVAEMRALLQTMCG